MYQALLTRRYLTSKIMPALAALAVTLCVATEIIVWSVMGGFLTQLLQSGRSVMGDVSISWPGEGFAHYDDLIDRLEGDERLAAAAPIIEGYALIHMPAGNTDHILVKGVDGPAMDRVTHYGDSLWWKPLDTPLPKDKDRQDPRLNPSFRDILTITYEAGLNLEWPPIDGPPPNAAVLGIEVQSKAGTRTRAGWLPMGYDFPGGEITLAVFATDRKGGLFQPESSRFAVANEFSSGVHEIDANTVMIDLATAQRLFHMDEAQLLSDDADPFGVTTDESGQETFSDSAGLEVDPARVTTVLVRAADGVPLDDARDACREVYSAFSKAHPDVPNAEFVNRHFVLTWADQNALYIAAVEKEIGLVMFIFAIISLTSVFLVLAIFWAMVSEKTKDVGILRALGAGRGGIAWLWLRYGLIIGVVGSILGGVLAGLIVHNINPIHDWLGTAFGFQIWDPRVYYLPKIPNELRVDRIAIIMAAGAIASVLGALWPAWRAANMHPVKALRFE